ncbi:MAG TPA: hypothetical protein VH331_17675 [Allosphingosinicella sp.]|jgi:hypothetical protein|nr:hypothetical protein [Allosphingosinicella sp.]
MAFIGYDALAHGALALRTLRRSSHFELLKQVPATANLTIVDVKMIDLENKVDSGLSAIRAEVSHHANAGFASAACPPARCAASGEFGIVSPEFQALHTLAELSCDDGCDRSRRGVAQKAAGSPQAPMILRLCGRGSFDFVPALNKETVIPVVDGGAIVELGVRFFM